MTIQCVLATLSRETDAPPLPLPPAALGPMPQLALPPDPQRTNNHQLSATELVAIE